MTAIHAQDERGDLVAIEFDNLPFQPVRSFVVTTRHAGVRRGGHKVGCQQLIFLTNGSATFSITNVDGVSRVEELKEIGGFVKLVSDDFIEYTLDEVASSILVLADKSYDVSAKER